MGKVMNIKLQEVTKNGEKVVQYKGRDGKIHDINANEIALDNKIKEMKNSLEGDIKDVQNEVNNIEIPVAVDENKTIVFSDRTQEGRGKKILLYEDFQCNENNEISFSEAQEILSQNIFKPVLFGGTNISEFKVANLAEMVGIPYMDGSTQKINHYPAKYKIINETSKKVIVITIDYQNSTWSKSEVSLNEESASS